MTFLRLGPACSLLALCVAACYETPQPNCVFLCGPEPARECPEDYMCGNDNRCHLVLSGGGLAECESPLPFDAAVADAPIDVSVGPDAETPDAETPPIDGGPDAGPATTTHSGTISVADISVQGHPELGHGGRVNISFSPVGGLPPVYDDRVPPGVGCAAWLYDLGLGQAPPPTVDQGVVTITGATAAMPPCDFYPGVGYACIAGGGMGGTIVAGAAGPGTAALIDSTPPMYTVSTADVGRYVSITGATLAQNNGEFPIVGVDTGTNTLIYGNPFAQSDGAFAGSYTVVAGAGPVPGAPPPEFLADTDTVMIALTPGGGMDFEAFAVNVSAGPSFTLDSASQTAITSMPLDGTATTLSCASGSCGSAIVTVVAIDTTDGTIPGGAPDYFMPDPSDKVAVVQCASFGTSVTIPAGAMAVLMSASPTRVQTAYFRDNFIPEANADGTNPTNILVGHGVIGFTTAPPPAVPDAAPPDAFPPDAAPPLPVDAAPPDAVILPPDAFPPDAQLPPPPDAFPPDAFPPDAAPPDALVCAAALAPTDDPGPTAQTLVISEINPGNYIELYNNTGATIALSGSPFWFCSPFSYIDLSTLGAGISIPPASFAVLPWPGFFSDTDAGGEVILYNSSLFADPNAIVDFVCWGTNPHGSRIDTAFTAGKWSSFSPASCAPALTGGAIHRLVATDGFNAADYDTTSPPTGQTCTP